MARAATRLFIALCLTIATALAQDARPRVPPGRDPGGVTVALVSTGIDYTLPAIAARLARDGEGEIIAWDIESNDNRPFDRSKGSSPAEWGGDGTAIASAILRDPGLRLVVVRIVQTDIVSIARAAAFLAQTPARVTVVPMWSSRRQDWEPFAQAAAHFKDMLFIAVPNDTGEPSYPAALSLENVVTVAASRSSADSIGYGGAAQQLSGSGLAVATASRVAAAALARNPKLGIIELKRIVAESAAR